MCVIFEPGALTVNWHADVPNDPVPHVVKSVSAEKSILEGASENPAMANLVTAVVTIVPVEVTFGIVVTVVPVIL